MAFEPEFDTHTAAPPPQWSCTTQQWGEAGSTKLELELERAHTRSSSSSANVVQSHSPGCLLVSQPASSERQWDERYKGSSRVPCVCVCRRVCVPPCVCRRVCLWSSCTNLAVPAGHVGRDRPRDLTGDGGRYQLLAPLHVGACRTG